MPLQSSSNLRVIFAGTPEFSVPCLRAVIATGVDVVAVYTQPDRPAGRGRTLAPSPVKQAAIDAGIAVEQPESLRDMTTQARLRELSPELLIVVAYGLILPKKVLAIPRLGCWNVHASRLPRWRGAAPIQRAILAGDAESGVCIMQMEAGLDTGPVLLSAALPIAADETAGSLHDRLAELSAGLIVAALEKLPLAPTPQADCGVTYAAKIEKSEAMLDWNQSAQQLARQVRAFNPFPGALATLGQLSVKVWRASAEAGEGSPGTILASDRAGILVACGEGALRLTELQKAGGKRLSAAQFLAGASSSLRER